MMRMKNSILTKAIEPGRYEERKDKGTKEEDNVIVNRGMRVTGMEFTNVEGLNADRDE